MIGRVWSFWARLRRNVQDRENQTSGGPWGPFNSIGRRYGRMARLGFNQTRGGLRLDRGGRLGLGRRDLDLDPTQRTGGRSADVRHRDDRRWREGLGDLCGGHRSQVHRPRDVAVLQLGGGQPGALVQRQRQRSLEPDGSANQYGEPWRPGSADVLLRSGWNHDSKRRLRGRAQQPQRPDEHEVRRQHLEDQAHGSDGAVGSSRGPRVHPGEQRRRRGNQCERLGGLDRRSGRLPHRGEGTGWPVWSPRL